MSMAGQLPDPDAARPRRITDKPGMQILVGFLRLVLALPFVIFDRQKD